MRRRDILTGAGSAAGTSLVFPTPAISQGTRRLTMVTDWPEGPGLLPSARRLAQTITDITDGRIQIDVTSSGEVVRPFETFDAVQSGVADMLHSHIGYFERKSPALHFYSGVPFGLTASEQFAWVRFGGGQALFDELAGAFNIKPILCCSTGAQMGGWFLNEIAPTQGLEGLRYRMAGPGAEVYRRLGAIVVLLPGSEIVSALRSGAIDACEWVGPWLDMAMGLHLATGFYYYPGWHEPGTAQTLGINRQVWESFSTSDQRLIETAAASEYITSLAEFDFNNALALSQLKAAGSVKLRRFDDSLLQTFAEISADIVAEIGAHDELSGRIHASFIAFRSSIRDWSDVAEGAYLRFRAPE